MSVDTRAQAGDLDQQAVTLAGQLLGGVDEGTACPGSAFPLVDDKALDPHPAPGALEIRDRVQRQAPDDPAAPFRDQYAARLIGQPVGKPLVHGPGAGRVTELGQQLSEPRRVRCGRRPDGRLSLIPHTGPNYPSPPAPPRAAARGRQHRRTLDAVIATSTV